MLMALLYKEDGLLIGAALACDQQPYGDRFWREIDPTAGDPRDCETAYVEIQDERLVERLLKMEFADGAEAAASVDEYLGLAPKMKCQAQRGRK